MAIDHDRTFKTLIREFFREFMELFLPKTGQLIDFSHVTFLEKEHLTDLPGGSRRRMDLVVEVRLKAEGEECILVHTEFEARRDPDFPRRMFCYYSQLFLRHGKPIVPVALFTDDAKWRKPIPDRYDVGVGEQQYVDFHYHLIKLKNLDYREYLKSENPLALALMAKMDYNKTDYVRLKAEFLRLIIGARQNSARQELLTGFIETYMPLDPAQADQFDEVVSSKPDYQEVKSMITVYEKRGIEKGIEKGMLEGKQDALIVVAEARFGEIPHNTRTAIRQIRDVERLSELVRLVATAENLSELPV